MAEGYIDTATVYTLLEYGESTYVVRLDQDVYLAVRFAKNGQIENLSDADAENAIERVITLTA